MICGVHGLWGRRDWGAVVAFRFLVGIVCACVGCVTEWEKRGGVVKVSVVGAVDMGRVCIACVGVWGMYSLCCELLGYLKQWLCYVVYLG